MNMKLIIVSVCRVHFLKHDEATLFTLT